MLCLQAPALLEPFVWRGYFMDLIANQKNRFCSQKKMKNNKWLIGAFALGAVLITGVLTLPGLQNLFKVQTLTLAQLGIVYLYAFLSLPIIQLCKWIRNRRIED